MALSTVDGLYACFDIINDKSVNEAKKVEAFCTIIEATKGGEKEKRLASQFIGRFFRHFKSLQEESFTCLLVLCDDPDVAIRKQSVHDLQSVCKYEPSFRTRVAYVFGQMLASEDASECHVIDLALSTLLTIDPKSTLTGIFNQMVSDTTESPRDHILKFLADNLKRLPEDALVPELEEFILEQTKKVLLDVSEEEFIQLITVLSSLKCMSTVTGRQKLVNMITSQILQGVIAFIPHDPACLAQVKESGKQTIRFLSKNVTAGPFLKYILEEVIPKLLEVPSETDQLCLLRILAEFSIHPGDALTSRPAEDRSNLLSSLYDLMFEMLPPIPSDPLTAFQSSSKDASVATSGEVGAVPGGLGSIRFFELECILYSFVNLINQHPLFLAFCEPSESDQQAHVHGTRRLQSLRPRLQYLARLLQSYKSAILGSFCEKFKGEKMSSGELLAEAKQAIANIEALLRLLFRNRPNLDTLHITPSWKKTSTTEPVAKRPVVLVSPAAESEQSLPHKFYRTGSGAGFVGRGRWGPQRMPPRR